MRMFDVMALPVLCYGAEVWSPQLVAATQDSSCSRVHLSFLRHLLGVRQSTPSLVVLAETGRLPLAANWTVQLARFWNTLIKADDGSLLQRAFFDAIDLAEGASGALVCQPWAAQFAAAMHRMGVSVDLQRPGQLSVAAVRNACMAWQLQQLTGAEGTKVTHYVRSVRGGQIDADSYRPAQYLDAVPQRSRRQALAQLRTGSHWLAEETGRWQRQQRQHRLCQHCVAAGQQQVEDVSHVLFHCPRFACLRDSYPDLFLGDSGDLSMFFSADPRQLASFARACYRLDHPA